MAELVGYVTVFALTFLITGGAAALAWALLDQSRSKRQESPKERPSILRSEMLSTLSSFAAVLEHIPLASKLKQELEVAEVDWSVGRTVLMTLVAGGATLKLLLAFGWVPGYVALAAALAAAAGPIFYVRRRRAKRMGAVEDQLPEALEYLSRALVTGHSLPMSLELMAEEVKPPLSAEVRKTVDEYNLGMSMNEALANLTRRVPSVDMQFFVSAILTQSRTGGTLHEVLEGLAETIRERATLKGQVRAMTANGRMTAVVLSLMPVFIALVMLYINPGYLGMLLQHPMGSTLIMMAAGGQILAYVVIRKIVDIKV